MSEMQKEKAIKSAVKKYFEDTPDFSLFKIKKIIFKS